MLQYFTKHMSLETQGIFASILGLILILGTLGKLEILQNILNSLMIITGLILIFWGINASNGYHRITHYFSKKHK